MVLAFITVVGIFDAVLLSTRERMRDSAMRKNAEKDSP
jgi:hypothetical protein